MPFFSSTKQVGHWRLSKEILGTGTTSTVVLATCTKLPTLCAAVKVISRRNLLVRAEADPNAVHVADAVIYKEVVMMKLLAHKRIVRLYDFFGIGDTAYIVMEHAPHKTLLDLFRACPNIIPHPLVVHVFAQLMQGLAYIHSLQIVHRDIKLENVFFFGPDVKAFFGSKLVVDFSVIDVKIGDFGLAHVDDPEQFSTVFHGSPHYQAPEVWARVPHRALPTDIWSAGVMLYALLCRRLPFDLTALRAASSGNKRAEDASTGYMKYDIIVLLPGRANELLKRLFAFDPTVRPTAKEVLLDSFFEGIPMEVDQVPDDQSEYVPDSLDFYDIAMLCIPPGKYVPCDTFSGTELECTVKARVLNPDRTRIEKAWMQKLSAYARDKRLWEANMKARIADKEYKERTKSLGRKAKPVGMLGPKETEIILPTRFTASLSFRHLFSKSAPKVHHNGVSLAPPPPKHSSQRPVPASSKSCSIANTLRSRQDTLMRRAHELGFRAGELQEFAAEADKIISVAHEGGGRLGLEEIAREIERQSANSVPEGSPCTQYSSDLAGGQTPSLGRESDGVASVAQEDTDGRVGLGGIARELEHQKNANPVPEGSPCTQYSSDSAGGQTPSLGVIESPLVGDGCSDVLDTPSTGYNPHLSIDSSNGGDGSPLSVDVPFHHQAVEATYKASGGTPVPREVMGNDGKPPVGFSHMTIPALRVVTQDGDSDGYVCFGI